ncbi:hypothetical protein LY78DRAFT_442368 [Colletotrichum sublineola]|nr:hypothetical protein LY78DRAFT_442368 [Colletotrichum sublineola]
MALLLPSRLRLSTNPRCPGIADCPACRKPINQSINLEVQVLAYSVGSLRSRSVPPSVVTMAIPSRICCSSTKLIIPRRGAASALFALAAFLLPLLRDLLYTQGFNLTSSQTPLASISGFFFFFSICGARLLRHVSPYLRKKKPVSRSWE